MGHINRTWFMCSVELRENATLTKFKKFLPCVRKVPMQNNAHATMNKLKTHQLCIVHLTEK